MVIPLISSWAHFICLPPGHQSHARYGLIMALSPDASAHTMVEGESFGQKRPPLSVLIKGILEKYPDGQIFKVCIYYYYYYTYSHALVMCHNG